LLKQSIAPVKLWL